MSAIALPGIIQGGMGIGVSDWRLARAVSSRGVSTRIGTAGRSRDTRRAVEPDSVKQMISAAPTVPVIARAASASASAVVGSALVWVKCRRAV